MLLEQKRNHKMTELRSTPTSLDVLVINSTGTYHQSLSTVLSKEIACLGILCPDMKIMTGEMRAPLYPLDE